MNPIILEGPDCAGKTTLAKELEKCGYKIVHNGPPKTDDPFREYALQIEESAKVNTVFDRLHIGEMIYGPILRGKSRITLYQYEELNEVIKRMGGLVVICLPPWRNVIDCWSEHQAQEHIKEYGQLRESYKKFCQVLEDNAYQGYWHYDYTYFDAGSFAIALTNLKGVKI